MSLVANGPPALSVRNLSKFFGKNAALKEVSFDLAHGEIHALVGENGSGKSTFIKCLSGYHQPERAAKIAVDGQSLPMPYGPADALRFGLGFVHQNLGLIPTLTVTENLGVYRGFGVPLLGSIDWRRQRDLAHAALEGFGSHIDPSARVVDLAQADKTLVAVARGLASAGESRKVLVLDEPTAALPASEVERLFSALRTLAAQGVSLIYVSHRLNEVLALADRVTVLQDGEIIGTMPSSELDEQKLANLIIGRSVGASSSKPSVWSQAEAMLEVNALNGDRISNVSFTVARGEIVGVAGLLGSGRSELGRLLFGAQQKKSGSIRLEGRPVEIASPADGLANGIGYVPEDRLGKGGVGRMSVAENITLPNMAGIWSNGRLRKSYERRIVKDLIKKYRIRPPDPDACFSSLSGGNQQKAIIAKSLRLNPRLLILDEPVQGVDVGSKAEIYELIQHIAKEGASIIIIDADFDDLCRFCDRILVLKEGRKIYEATGEARSRELIADLVLTSQGSANVACN